MASVRVRLMVRVVSIIVLLPCSEYRVKDRESILLGVEVRTV